MSDYRNDDDDNYRKHKTITPPSPPKDSRKSMRKRSPVPRGRGSHSRNSNVFQRLGANTPRRPPPNSRPAPPKTRTVCRNWKDKGRCSYAEKCIFQHPQELAAKQSKVTRVVRQLSPKRQSKDRRSSGVKDSPPPKKSRNSETTISSSSRNSELESHNKTPSDEKHHKKAKKTKSIKLEERVSKEKDDLIDRQILESAEGADARQLQMKIKQIENEARLGLTEAGLDVRPASSSDNSQSSSSDSQSSKQQHKIKQKTPEETISSAKNEKCVNAEEKRKGSKIKDEPSSPKDKKRIKRERSKSPPTSREIQQKQRVEKQRESRNRSLDRKCDEKPIKQENKHRNDRNENTSHKKGREERCSESKGTIPCLLDLKLAVPRNLSPKNRPANSSDRRSHVSEKDRRSGSNRTEPDVKIDQPVSRRHSKESNESTNRNHNKHSNDTIKSRPRPKSPTLDVKLKTKSEFWRKGNEGIEREQARNQSKRQYNHRKMDIGKKMAGAARSESRRRNKCDSPHSRKHKPKSHVPQIHKDNSPIDTNVDINSEQKLEVNEEIDSSAENVHVGILEEVSDEEEQNSKASNVDASADWASLMADCTKEESMLAPTKSTLRRRFAPHRFLRTVPFSPNLLGPELINKIEDVCNNCPIDDPILDTFKLHSSTAVEHAATVHKLRARLGLAHNAEALSAKRDLEIRRDLYGMPPKVIRFTWDNLEEEEIFPPVDCPTIIPSINSVNKVQNIHSP